MTERQLRGKGAAARPSRWFGLTIAVSTMGAIASFVVLGVLTGQPANGDVPGTIAGIGAALSLLVAGAVLVSRVPRNPISWMLWVAGLSFALNSVSSGLAQKGLTEDPGSVPGAIWLAWLNQWIGQLPLGFIVLLPLLYPTGRLPSRRWRIVFIVGLVAISAGVVQAAFSPFAPGTYPSGVRNPVEVGGWAADVLTFLSAAATVPGIAVFLLIPWSLLIRYRRAAGIERQQLKWFAFVGAITVLAALIGIAAQAYLAWLIALLGLGLLPMTIMFAILRHRLYDIDLVIRRTLVYGALAALLALVYGGSVLALSTALAPIASGNSLAVAGGTLLVAALFAPVRRRLQAAVDRRFYRSRYDAAGALADFSHRLRGGVDLEGMRSEIAGTVYGALKPASVALWLRTDGRPRSRS